jgi:hypothetical protein
LRARPKRGRAVRTALAVGLAVLAVSIAATLPHALRRLLGSNDVRTLVGFEADPVRVLRLCQRDELLPRGTAAVRLSLSSGRRPGPAVRVSAIAGGRPVASGYRAAGWRQATLVVPLRDAVARDVLARVCVAIAAGPPVNVAVTAAPGEGETRLRIDELHAGRDSWWSFLPTIVHRIGLGHAWSGPSVALVVALLTLAAVGLAVRQVARAEGDPRA